MFIKPQLRNFEKEKIKNTKNNIIVEAVVIVAERA